MFISDRSERWYVCHSAGVVAPSGELCLIGVYHHAMMPWVPLLLHREDSRSEWGRGGIEGTGEKIIVKRGGLSTY